MAELKLGNIKPVGADNVVVEGKYVKGGYVVVETLTERDALKGASGENIIKGSLCYCQEDSKFYQYDGTNWVEANLGGGNNEIAAPFKYGEAALSIIQADVSAKAIAKGAVATGNGAMAGSRGFRYLKRETASDHDLERQKSTSGSKVTTYYTCACDKCKDKQLAKKTFSDTVYNADLVNDIASGQIRVNPEGLVYKHFATGGNTITTTITANNVPLGMAMFMKYRLANGGTPTGSLTVGITYTVEGKEKYVLAGAVEASAETLAKRRIGWVVDRVNIKGALKDVQNNGTKGTLYDSYLGTVVDSIRITIKHKDDFDLAFFYSDPDSTEKNLNVFPQMVADDDIYYIHSVNSSGTAYFGAYSSNQWRKITNAANGSTSKPGETVTHYTDKYGPEEQQISLEAFYIKAPEDSTVSELENALLAQPDCTIITQNEYPHIKLHSYKTTKQNGSPITLSVGAETHNVWKLLFLTSDFKTALEEPRAGWEDDAPYKKTVRINTHPELGDTDIGMYTFTQGINAKALAYASVALGRDTRAEGSYAVAEGRQTRAVYAAHAEGRETEALGDASHAEGFRSKTTNTFDHAEGNTTTACGGGSHAEGSETLAKGEASHAEGSATEALGDASHAEGTYAIAAAGSSHAEGYMTQALKDCSHAEGSGTTANGEASHAAGIGTIASADAQTAIGKFNKEDPDALFVVGNGTGFDEDERSNAFVVKKTGIGYLDDKKIYVEGDIKKEALVNIPPSEGLAYSLNADGESYTVTGRGACTDTELIIPAEIEGKPVTSIGNSAFTGFGLDPSVALTGVVIPDSITSISDGAFAYQSNLESVIIGKGVTSIGYQAFYSCLSLKNVVIPDSVTSIGVGAFAYCSRVYCEAPEKPEGWSDSWNEVLGSGKCSVVWNFAGDFISVNEKIEELKDSSGSVGHTKYLTFEQYYNTTYGEFYNITGTQLEDEFPEELIIPKEYNNLPVLGINGKAFAKAIKNLKYIVIPSTIISIGDHAFGGEYGYTLYCEATTAASGWNASWDFDSENCTPVVWNYPSTLCKVANSLNTLDNEIRTINSKFLLVKGNGAYSLAQRLASQCNGASAAAFNTGYAKGDYSFAEGAASAIGRTSHAEGELESKADGETPESYTRLDTAIRNRASLEGLDPSTLTVSPNFASAYGRASHREGRNTMAVGDFSHAQGEGTLSYGLYSHAQNYCTQAIGVSSTAMGEGTEAKGLASVATGSLTVAVNDFSSAHGKDTFTAKDAQFVVGKYNAADSTSMFVVGVGSQDNLAKPAVKENCFATGKNSSGKHYIKVGETTLTEDDLKALLSLIGTMKINTK